MNVTGMKVEKRTCLARPGLDSSIETRIDAYYYGKLDLSGPNQVPFVILGSAQIASTVLIGPPGKHTRIGTLETIDTFLFSRGLTLVCAAGTVGSFIIR
jgi:hypothetical protein